MIVAYLIKKFSTFTVNKSLLLYSQVPATGSYSLALECNLILASYLRKIYFSIIWHPYSYAHGVFPYGFTTKTLFACVIRLEGEIEFVFHLYYEFPGRLLPWIRCKHKARLNTFVQEEAHIVLLVLRVMALACAIGQYK